MLLGCQHSETSRITGSFLRQPLGPRPGQLVGENLAYQCTRIMCDVMWFQQHTRIRDQSMTTLATMTMARKVLENTLWGLPSVCHAKVMSNGASRCCKLSASSCSFASILRFTRICPVLLNPIVDFCFTLLPVLTIT